MIQGTTSDAGKSLLVAGLCRVLHRKGISVAPFKPQNMSLNSAVTPSGGEIGRAQALQAIACGLALDIDFNPVLLKPTSNSQSQVIIHGKAVSQLEAKRFGNIKALAFSSVLDSYKRLKNKYDVILIEGAGSPAEVNLRKNDIANMGFAESVDCPVILISDIDRGGVFAHLKGTLDILSKSENNRVKGMVINKFRGNIDLLKDGLDWIENKTEKPVLGILPYMLDLKLDSEDGVKAPSQTQNGTINIAVIVLPRISNHTDFEPLLANDNVNLDYLRFPEELKCVDLIIIPGSKNVIDDMVFLDDSGWSKSIKQHCRYGGKVLGICGGYQMLGIKIFDPLEIESKRGEVSGLSLLHTESKLEPVKQLKNVKGFLKLKNTKNVEINGYEIHCGTTSLKNAEDDLSSTFCDVTDQFGHCYSDGVISEDQQVLGTYLHGLFESKDATEAILSWVTGNKETAEDWNEIRDQELNRLADMLEENMDIDKVMSIIK